MDPLHAPETLVTCQSHHAGTHRIATAHAASKKLNTIRYCLQFPRRTFQGGNWIQCPSSASSSSSSSSSSHHSAKALTAKCTSHTGAISCNPVVRTTELEV